MEITESVDLRVIYYLSGLTYKEYSNHVVKKCSEEEKKKSYNIFKSLCKSHKKAKGEIVRLYAHTLKTPNEVGGRLFCGGSVQGLPRDIRGAIMKHTTDIDMANAHPKILLYICKKHNISCPNLEYYCSNREKVYNSISDDRDYCKTLFLKAVNNDKLTRTEKNAFFKTFDKECKAIQNKLCALPLYNHVVASVPENKLYNWTGSAINRILCKYENEILNVMVSLLTRRSIPVAVLAFDGCMAVGDYYNDPELLMEMENLINEKFKGLDMKLTYKSHSTKIKVPDDYEISMETEQPTTPKNTFENVCEEFEDKHCKITNSSSFIKLYNNRIIYMNRTQLMTSYEHLKYFKKVEDEVTGDVRYVPTSFIKDWLTYGKMRRYENVGIYPAPLKCPEDEYNLWTPFASDMIEEYEDKPEELKIILHHIKVLCGNQEDVYDYFIKWIGQMIQYPAVKSICPVLISQEGAGKGTLLKLLNKMLGSEKVYETTKPSRDVWGDFNGRMCNSFLVNLNELSKKETTDATNYIKGLITDDAMTINNKGVGQYDIKSYHRFIITTNNEEPINTQKGDRRKLIIRCSDELINNKKYFTTINKYLNDIDVIKTCYEYFKSIKGLDNFMNIKIPITEYQEDLAELAIKPIEMWMQNHVTSCIGTSMENEIISYKAKELFDLFTVWVKNNWGSYDMNLLQFCVRLKRLDLVGVTKKKGKFNNKTLIDIQKYKNHYLIEKED